MNFDAVISDDARGWILSERRRRSVTLQQKK